MNGDRPQRNNLVPVQDSDVFTFCRSFQKRRQIRPSLSWRQRSHARYYDDMESNSSGPPPFVCTLFGTYLRA
jgi:hypothetical protein